MKFYNAIKPILDNYDALIEIDGKAVINLEDWKNIYKLINHFYNLISIKHETDMVSSIIERILEANGYDGLCVESCGCHREDIRYCEYSTMDCRPVTLADCQQCDSPCDSMTENI